MKNQRFLQKTWVRVLLAVLAAAVVFCCADLVRVAGLREKPRFCVPVQTADDGGSGIYIGLLYGFSVRGDFMPEDPPPRVTEYTWYLLGIPAVRGNVIIKD